MWGAHSNRKAKTRHPPSFFWQTGSVQEPLGSQRAEDKHAAFTTLYELTGREIHRRKLLEVIDVLWSRMFHPGTWTGIAQFALAAEAR